MEVEEATSDKRKGSMIGTLRIWCAEPDFHIPFVEVLRVISQYFDIIHWSGDSDILNAIGMSGVAGRWPRKILVVLIIQQSKHC